MLGLELVRPLEDNWREALDDVAASRRWVSSRDPRRLAARVAELSSAYNDASRARAPLREAGPARLAFSFARDVPKGAAAVREIIATSSLAGADRSGQALRVLDVGAGFGAMTWGFVRALDAAGRLSRVEATWVDEEEEGLDVGRALASARRWRSGSVELAAQSIPLAVAGRGSLGAVAKLGPFDVVLVGQLLSELDVGAPDDERVRRHSALVREMLSVCVAPEGFVVVIEPALRDRTRHLHRVRDTLLEAEPDARPVVFAPCLHCAACPALAAPGDWCHEDLPVDLPSWLIPIARGAGLRFQGLTFSYLVVRPRGSGLVERLERRPGAHLRVVSDRRVTKGKSEAFLCGNWDPVGIVPPGRRSVSRLDRDAGLHTAVWDTLSRGDLVAIAPPPLRNARNAGARIDASTRVERLDVRDATSLPAHEPGASDVDDDVDLSVDDADVKDGR
jgi:hypothetical protein